MKPNQTLSMLLMLTATAGLAIAQPSKTSTNDQDVLRGPDVVETNNKDNNAKDNEQIELTPEQVKAELEKNPIQMREMTGIVRRLANDRLGTTPEQDAQIKEILNNYREEIRAFQEANQEQIRTLRDQMNKETREHREQLKQKQSEQNENTMQGEDKPARPEPFESEAAKKLREMMANAPATKAAIKGIFAVLNEEQAQMVKMAVVKSRHSEQKRPNDTMNRRNSGGDDARRPARRGVDSEQVRPAERRNRDAQRDKTGKDDD